MPANDITSEALALLKIQSLPIRQERLEYLLWQGFEIEAVEARKIISQLVVSDQIIQKPIVLDSVKTVWLDIPLPIEDPIPPAIHNPKNQTVSCQSCKAEMLFCAYCGGRLSEHAAETAPAAARGTGLTQDICDIINTLADRDWTRDEVTVQIQACIPGTTDSSVHACLKNLKQFDKYNNQVRTDVNSKRLRVYGPKRTSV